ncbi:GNAT family N-acetyltransferase [Chlorobium phaeovibrioides]|uniref:GNAT family N-acetyltransferase n=1 Tax=Chlorobium phaeovibrioides TaxID=1094 RepID=A0A5M8IE05_CHLPH|nr:GNAT family N-acetyltransferase [Chlorobium phaeovibrioides]KAA6232692.1 GNAT family N-acetyltransferase [Chlorobium phaeovibrioides]MWV53770.1 GNAT family N-acetyltransferase [Chlorobium phaeovibrioides]QEQ56918.1 GNAT family N-acetyltransferase [Chlorobium phaeovibrioides]RTY37374.1 GNAT family N-acetyltransferase [Chlorobium phaeovibrioides]
MSGVTVRKIESAADRHRALEVIEQVFRREKNWISAVHEQMPEGVENDSRVSWFLAEVNGRPAGIIRLLYDPPLELPEGYGVSFEPGVDLEKLRTAGRYAEIGRFMILGEYRRNPRVALRLMRSATAEVVERDYTHFITDVFEGEANSPFNFHTRVLGFEVVGKHLFGDLNCSSTRIILTLDILKLYRRVKNSRSRIYMELTEGIRTVMERKAAMRRRRTVSGA